MTADRTAAAGVPLTYILGVGRSGSTLVERMLASAPGAKAMGEVHALWRLPLPTLTCSCGAPGPDCPVWSETRARAGFDGDGLKLLSQLERRAIRHRTIARVGFSLSAFLRHPDVEAFRSRQEALFAAFAETTSAGTLIDSSKAAPRAWALAGRGRTRILRLTRDTGAVRASWAARKADPSRSGPMEARSGPGLMRETIVERVSFRLLSRQTAITALRYEDLVVAPRAALGDALGANTADAVAWRGAARFAPDPDYHSLLGNPDRFQRGEIEVRAPSPRARRAAA